MTGQSMKLADVPADATFLDVDGLAVTQLPSGECLAFKSINESRPYPNARKAGLEGDALTPDEFRSWLVTGRNRFDGAVQGELKIQRNPRALA
jgi:hypothetical protein